MVVSYATDTITVGGVTIPEGASSSTTPADPDSGTAFSEPAELSVGIRVRGSFNIFGQLGLAFDLALSVYPSFSFLFNFSMSAFTMGSGLAIRPPFGRWSLSTVIMIDKNLLYAQFAGEIISLPMLQATTVVTLRNNQFSIDQQVTLWLVCFTFSFWFL